jgi:hypothetical protein
MKAAAFWANACIIGLGFFTNNSHQEQKEQRPHFHFRYSDVKSYFQLSALVISCAAEKLILLGLDAHEEIA